MDFIFYLTLFLFVALFGSIDNMIDYDFWARLIVGKSFFQTGQLFNHDFYSYGTTHQFIDHEWASSLIFYLVQNNFGDIGIYFFKTLIVFLTFFIAAKAIRLQKKEAKFHFLFFFFVIQAICYNIFSTVRCQSFSFLFFTLFFYILTYCKTKRNYRPLWCLPILGMIWANMHGGFVLGLAIILIFALGEFLNKNKKFALCLFITFLISCIFTLINPWGVKYLVFILEAFKLNREHIIEWQSAFLNKNYLFFLIKFKIFFILNWIIFLYSITKNIASKGFIGFYQKIDKTKYLILIFMSLICLKALRCHTFFALSVLILCYKDFYDIFNKKLPQKIDNTKEIILLILISISALSHLLNYKFINTLNPREYPVYAVEFIKQNNIKGNVFTMFHTGSYVAYKLYPDNLVFMDGRYEEVYDNKLIDEMREVFLAKNQDEFFKKYSTDILITDNKYPLKKALNSDPKWFLAYEDKFWSLWLTKKPNKNFKQPNKNMDYYNQTKFETEIDWLK